MTQQVSVTLSDRWAEYLTGLVADRRFESTDHALEDALRLLEKTTDSEERLRRLLEEGEASGDAGPWDLQAFLAEARARDDGREAA